MFPFTSDARNLNRIFLQEKGHRGIISKAKLLEKLKEIQGKGQAIIEGYIIEGADIISIIQETDLDIKIENAIIKGGLDFTQLPGLSLDMLKLPEAWSEEEKSKWRQKQYWDERYYQVTNNIAIESSTIESLPSPDEKVAINANGTFFNGIVRFSSTTFSGSTHFGYATFSGKADFESTTFSDGYAIFESSTFSGPTDFYFATFSGSTHFGYATFSGKADFESTTFSGEANFDSAIFSGGYAIFGFASFRGDADFSSASFRGGADFGSASFRGAATFPFATFIKLAYFNSARFFTRLDMKHVDCKEYADLRNTWIRRLDWNSVDSPTILRGRLDFRGSTISEVHIQDVIFEKDVYFSDVKFGVLVEEEESNPSQKKKTIQPDMQEAAPLTTIFRFVTFESAADFKRAQFQGNTAFENVTFLQDANFIDADFHAGEEKSDPKFTLSYISYKNLFINWESFPAIQYWRSDVPERVKSFSDVAEEKKRKDKNREEKAGYKLEPLSHVLQSFEENFKANNQLADANQAYYHRKRAELAEAAGGDDFWLKMQRQAEWIFMGIPCGYGTKICWIIGWSALLTLLFAVLYSLKGEVSRKPQPGSERDFVFKQRFLDFPKHYSTQESQLKVEKQSVRNFINALRLSAVILFKIGCRDTTISGKIGGMDYRYLVWVEWALGYYVLSLLVITLSNTLPLLNRLITGVF